MMRMSWWPLAVKEIRHSRSGFLLGASVVGCAVCCVVCAALMLAGHEIRSSMREEAKEKQLEQRLARLRKEYREMVERMGFSVKILPAGQSTAGFFSDGFSRHNMSLEIFEKIAAVPGTGLHTFVPVLRKKMFWPERKQTVMIVGIGAARAVKDASTAAAFLRPVETGFVDVGRELHRGTSLAAGDRIAMKGRSFEIRQCRGLSGSADDIGLFMHLAQAQSLLGANNRISEIWACRDVVPAGVVGEYRDNLKRVCPSCRVVENTTKQLMQKRSLQAATRGSLELLRGEKAHNQRVWQRRKAILLILATLVSLVCVVWIVLLGFANVNLRLKEIGVFRALGWKRRRIALLFLMRSVLLGCSGAAVGLALGVALGLAVGRPPVGQFPANPGTIAAIAVSLPLIAAFSGALPSLWAASRRPSEILAADR